MKKFWPLIKQTLKEFGEDKVLRLSAALAYYSLFSIAPLLLIVIMIAGAVFGREAVQGEIEQQLQGFIGENAASTVESMVESARRPDKSVAMSLVGFGTLIFGATGVFGQLKDALNTIWGIAIKPGRGVLGFLKDRFLSFTMVLGIAFLLLVSLFVSAMLSAFGGWAGNLLPLPAALMQVINLVISLGVIMLLFAMIFKVLPDAKVDWRDVWIGAGATAVLFTLGKFVLGWYLGRESTASAYGAAGSVIVLVLWVYYSSVILLLGAEFTQVYASATGHRIQPDEDAVRMSEEKRAREGIPTREQLERKVREQA